MEDLQKYCKYFQGEETNPYLGKDLDKASFWAYEQNYYKTFTQEHRDEWIELALSHAKKYKDLPFLNDALHTNIEKGFYFYAYNMICKWNPYDSELIFKYEGR